MSTENEGAPPGGDGQPGPVPYSRFAQVNARVAELTAAADAAKAGEAAAKAAAAEWEGKHAAAASDWGTERAIMQRGITDAEGLAVTKVLFGMVPPEARPADGIAGWLGAMTPETAPIALRPYLGGKVTQAAPPPTANAGATGRSADQPGQVTIEAYRAARTEAVKRGTLQAFADSPLAKAFEGRT